MDLIGERKTLLTGNTSSSERFEQRLKMRAAMLYLTSAFIGVVVFCAIVDWETIGFGIVVAGFVVPSILSFALLRHFAAQMWGHVAFWFINLLIIVSLGVFYMIVPRHEGADQLVKYSIEILVIATFSAYVVMCIRELIVIKLNDPSK